MFAIAWVPPHEIQHVYAVQHRAANLRQRIGALPALAHVALVLHALVSDVLDRRLGAARGDRPVLPIPLSMVD